MGTTGFPSQTTPMMSWSCDGTRSIQVQHSSEMDGGGTWFGQDYIAVIRGRYDRSFGRCLEWCAGPGFIGFNLLSHGLCEHVTLVDAWAPCVIACRATIAQNHLVHLADAFCANDLTAWPDIDPFDLIVANPPHYLECPGDLNYQRLAVDQDWQAHENFYKHIRPLLADDGRILMQENQAGSLNGVEDFRHMIESHGLEIMDVFPSQEFWHNPGPWAQIYYIEIRRKKSQT